MKWAVTLWNETFFCGRRFMRCIAYFMNCVWRIKMSSPVDMWYLFCQAAAEVGVGERQGIIKKCEHKENLVIFTSMVESKLKEMFKNSLISKMIIFFQNIQLDSPPFRHLWFFLSYYLRNKRKTNYNRVINIFSILIYDCVQDEIWRINDY